MITFNEDLECPCGSGKLTKDCLLNPHFRNNGCKLFLPTFGKIYENNINIFIKDTMIEITETVGILEKHSSAVRSQTSVLIIFVDVLSKIWDLFYFKERGNKIRLTSWFNEFIATNDNKFWESHTEIQKLNSNLFYNLRNSLLHSFALPKADEAGINIALNKNAPTSEVNRLKELNNIVISPIDLFYLIRDGVDLMLKNMSLAKKDINDYYLRIINIGKAIEEEGAVIILDKDFMK